MDTNKLNRIKAKMKEQGMPQMVISDPVAIFYLTGKWILPGERLSIESTAKNWEYLKAVLARLK